MDVSGQLHVLVKPVQHGNAYDYHSKGLWIEYR
jgi:aromatic ring-cleaving dioxygenase